MTFQHCADTPLAVSSAQRRIASGVQHRAAPSGAIQTAPPQRATGHLFLSVRERRGETVIDRLRQQGCLKVRFPRRERGAVLEAILLNTAGGITGGDALETAIHVAQPGYAVVTTQAAERFYRAAPGAPSAQLRTRLAVDRGADLAWLPQETILFDGCRIDRRLDVDLQAGSRFLGIETLLLGRAAMGEALDDVRLLDRIAIRIDGCLMFQDMLRLTGNVGVLAARPGIADGARGVATILSVAPTAEGFVAPLRALLQESGTGDAEVEAGVTFWRGVLLVRLLSRDGVALRRKLIEAIALLRNGAPLPIVWQS